MGNRYTEFESLFSKHTMYLLNIIQQIIQSQRFKAILTILGVISKNGKEWIRTNLRNNQANYTTNSLVHAGTNTRIVNDKPSNQKGEDSRQSMSQHTSKIDSIEYSYRK